MKVLKPFYYDDFKCISGDCIDNCCHAEWEISIDKKTYKKYRKLKGQWGNKINNNIGRIRSNISDLRYGKIKLKDKGCSLLDEEGLCSIHAKLGERYLCNTCRVYPRMVIKFGEIYERNLYMSCPEVARYLIKYKGNFYFNMDEEELSNLDKDYIVDKIYDEKLYNLLWDSRSLAMEIIQFKEIEIWKRIIFLKILTDKVQTLIDEEKYENYQNLLNAFRNEIINIEVINSLDKISIVEDIKLKFIKGILEAKNVQGVNGKKYINLINEYNNLFQDDNDEKIIKLISKNENEFNDYIKKSDNILENLLVYLIYKYFMNTLYTKDLKKEVNNIIISYSIIRMLLLGRWFKNNKKLEEEDFVEIFYVFSRVIEHNQQFLNNLYKNIKNAGYDKIAYTTILVH